MPSALWNSTGNQAACARLTPPSQFILQYAYPQLSIDFGEREFKRSLIFLFRMSWSIERRQPDRPLALESFSGRGGAWVVVQFIVMTAWLVLTPKGHKLTDSALGRVAATGLAQRRGGRWRLWCVGIGKKPDSVSEASCTGGTRPA
jgi:hypothetical protein